MPLGAFKSADVACASSRRSSNNSSKSFGLALILAAVLGSALGNPVRTGLSCSLREPLGVQLGGCLAGGSEGGVRCEDGVARSGMEIWRGDAGECLDDAERLLSSGRQAGSVFVAYDLQYH